MAPVTHNFERDGSRSFGKRQLGPLTMWFAESASFHRLGTTHYGAYASHWPENWEAGIEFGRWAWRISW